MLGLKRKVHIALLTLNWPSLLFALAVTSAFRWGHVCMLELMEPGCKGPALRPPPSSVALVPASVPRPACPTPRPHAKAPRQGWQGDELPLHKADFHSLGTGAKCPFVWTAGKAVTLPLPALCVGAGSRCRRKRVRRFQAMFSTPTHLPWKNCLWLVSPNSLLFISFFFFFFSLSSLCTELLHNKSWF